MVPRPVRFGRETDGKRPPNATNRRGRSSGDEPMSERLTTSFTIASWDEEPFSEIEGGGKLSHARIVNRYSGEIEGEGTLEYLMLYRPDNTAADYAGLERIVGRVGGRSGSFVLEHRGRYENGVARTRLTVASGSGTGDLAGLRGEGGYEAAEQQQPVHMTLTCSFA